MIPWKRIFAHFFSPDSGVKPSTRRPFQRCLCPKKIVIPLTGKCLVICVKCCCLSGSPVKRFEHYLSGKALYKSSHLFFICFLPVSRDRHLDAPILILPPYTSMQHFDNLCFLQIIFFYSDKISKFFEWKRNTECWQKLLSEVSFLGWLDREKRKGQSVNKVWSSDRYFSIRKTKYQKFDIFVANSQNFKPTNPLKIRSIFVSSNLLCHFRCQKSN